MRLSPLLLIAVLARFAVAQLPGSPNSAPGARVSGVVRDSIGRAPLAGAWVQLAATDGLAHFARTVASDSLGRFAFDGVPSGRYAIGFIHPMLDSLGIEPPIRELTVSGRRPVHADLAIPSPAQLRAAICGAPSGPRVSAGAVLIGVVRDARTRASAAGAKVTAEWLELTFRPGGMDWRRPRIVATTGESGWFALCNLPSGGTMFVGAARGRESTDLIEVQVPAEGFVRRELFLGAARVIGHGDSTLLADTLAHRRQRGGDGRLRGTVITGDGSRPLAGAIVRITDGPMAVADERGAWALAEAPLGTRVLDVRAVGFYPARVPVDVVVDAPPVQVSLVTFKAMLDTVRITATRVADRQHSGFEERRRSTAGSFLTASDIERRGALFTSDIFRHVVGVRLGYASDTVATDIRQALTPDVLETVDRRILMRGIGSGWCVPVFYLDGAYFPNMEADALDSWIRPEHLAGIEVYSEATIPAAYQRLRNGCGAILLWTK